jgi:multicomponent Na+:H+ antiporter subunit G
MNLLTTILAGACLLSGAFFMLAAAVGILRLPDVLCRSHALAKAMTLGIILMLTGLWLHLGGEEGFSGLKVTLAVFFQLVTVPVASHLLSLLAWEKNLPRWRHRPVADHRQPPPSNPPANRAD